MPAQQEPEDLQRDGVAGGSDDVSLDPHQQAVLVRLLRVMYPHPSFPDGPYHRTSQAIQEAAGAAEILPAGLADLDAAAGGDFTATGDDQALSLVTDRSSSDLVTLVHSTSVVALYDDHEVWELLGYEGASFEKGGYLNRGFDDLDWLPDPRIEEYQGDPRPELIDEGEK